MIPSFWGIKQASVQTDNITGYCIYFNNLIQKVKQLENNINNSTQCTFQEFILYDNDKKTIT